VRTPEKPCSDLPAIAELVSLAATLLCLPAAIAYLLTLVAVANHWLDIRDNLLLLMMLAFSGFGLFLLSLVGLVATVMQRWRIGAPRRRLTVAMLVHGGILTTMLLLWISGWQIPA